MALARALAVEPQVLLLDEPFGALDAKVRKDLRTWLRHLHDEMHVTTIFVTHDQEEAMDVAGQLVVMNEGRVEQSGTADELYEHPANEFVMSFVGEVNRLGDDFVRPHDMEVVLDPDERTEEGLVQRIVALGFEIRVEFVLADGTEVWAQLTRNELQRLELREGQIAYLRPVQAKSFNGSSPSDSLGPRLPTGPRTAATQRYLQPSEGATGRGALLPGDAPPHLATQSILTPTAGCSVIGCCRARFRSTSPLGRRHRVSAPRQFAATTGHQPRSAPARASSGRGLAFAILELVDQQIQKGDRDDQTGCHHHLPLAGPVHRAGAGREPGRDRAEPDQPRRQPGVGPERRRRGALLPGPPDPRRLPPPPPALSHGRQR